MPMAAAHHNASMETATFVFSLTGRLLNQTISFLVFCFLDLLDFLLCFLYKLADFLLEAQWKPCYCSSPITSSSNIIVSEHGRSKVVCLSSSRLHLEDISDTLYARPSLFSHFSNLRTIGLPENTPTRSAKLTNSNTFAVNSTIFQMLQAQTGGHHPIPRWSDCDCHFCNSWASSSKETLFVKAEGTDNTATKEDVIFVHGFISSSAFWTETLFPNFSSTAKSTYRFLAVDLLGFGRSPKPTDSLYTLREHVDMIEKSVLEAYKVKSFHIVAHSLGCILALALAVKHPGSVKSITLLAPPYYPVPKGEEGAAAQYVMRRVAPRRVWPPMAFCASIGCWYEHVTRTVCLLICKNHRLWEFLAKLVTRNRMRTFLLEGFFCHTHNAAWHTLHNIICGAASKLDGYLEAVRDCLKCEVTIFHGEDDELIPVECSYDVQARIPRARVKVVEKKDHITIVVGRQKAFARELEQIWKASNC